MRPEDFKKWRKGKALSIEGAASFVRVNPRTVRRWEQGVCPIPKTIDVLFEIAAELERLKKDSDSCGQHDPDRVYY